MTPKHEIRVGYPAVTGFGSKAIGPSKARFPRNLPGLRYYSAPVRCNSFLPTVFFSLLKKVSIFGAINSSSSTYRQLNWRRRLLLLLPLLFLISHLSSILKMRHIDKVENLTKKTTTKFDHLVLGSAAGQGLSNRLQCQGTKALNSTHSKSSAHVSISEESIAFVTVFSIYKPSGTGDAGRSSSNRVVVGNFSFSNRVERSMAILDTYIQFIQVTMPQSRIFILTDPASDLNISRERVLSYPIPGDYSRETLMLQRIKSYTAFLDARAVELSKTKNERTCHYIFTDSDIAVVNDLSQIFNEYPNFDVALTFRNNKDQPLNSGFVAVRGTLEAVQRAKAFLLEVLEAYSTRYMSASRMLGDQLALVWVVKSHLSLDPRRFAKPSAFMEELNGVSVLFLPCSVYNWTPPEGAGQFRGMPLDVKVVHFKGSRKRLMLEAWNLYNSTHNIDDMLCLVLASGRTKYDF
ncbi:hypothetical protein V2J09_012568 [Rumex salicifolius]